MKQTALTYQTTSVYFENVCELPGYPPSRTAGYLIIGFNCGTIKKLEIQDFHGIVPNRGWKKYMSMNLRLIMINNKTANVNLYDSKEQLEHIRNRLFSFFEHLDLFEIWSLI